MSEVDLIPAEFRQGQRLRMRLKAAALTYGVLVAVLLVAKLGLGHALKQEQQRIDTLTAEENAILKQRQSYDELQSRRGKLQEYLEVLKGLRGGPKAEQMFVVLDRAINDQVWMTSWRFLRAGEEPAAAPDKPASGYLGAVSATEAPRPEQWRNALRMEISGQALTHSALAEFVNTLQDQREIAEVKLQSTSENPYLSDYAIAYQLSVRVNAQEGAR